MGSGPSTVAATAPANATVPPAKPFLAEDTTPPGGGGNSAAPTDAGAGQSAAAAGGGVAGGGDLGAAAAAGAATGAATGGGGGAGGSPLASPGAGHDGLALAKTDVRAAQSTPPLPSVRNPGGSGDEVVPLRAGASPQGPLSPDNHVSPSQALASIPTNDLISPTSLGSAALSGVHDPAASPSLLPNAVMSEEEEIAAVLPPKTLPALPGRAGFANLAAGLVPSMHSQQERKEDEPAEVHLRIVSG